MEKNNKIVNLRYNLILFSLVSSCSINIGAVSYEIFDNKNIEVNYCVDIYDDVITPMYISDKIDSPIDSYISIDSYCENTQDYSGMALSNQLEDDIKIIADKYDIPYQIVLAIGERESDGKWNNNGVISPTNDYGEFQINECNLEYIEDNLGYTKEEILYDSNKNAEACIFLLNEIVTRDDVTTLNDIFGMYNGWINWEKKPQSVEYVDACSGIMDKYFPDYQYNLQY